MRTTIEIDDKAMAVARSTAVVEGVSLGAAISRLILLSQQDNAPAAAPGFPAFAAVAGHVITDDLVARHRDDE